LRQQNQTDAAMIQYQLAIALNPHYIDAHLQLGASLHALGNYEEAIVCYQQAISLNSNLLDAYYNLGNVLLNRGRYEEAIVSLSTNSTIHPCRD
jgi:tetratricopeptide (TPR) repeat protein